MKQRHWYDRSFKRILSFFLLLLFWGNNAISSVGHIVELSEDSKIKVIYNGNMLYFTSDPLIVNNRVLVPLRQLAEQMGATVEWMEGGSKGEGSIYVRKDGRPLASASIGTDSVLIDDREIGGKFFLDQPIRIINEQVYVPIRFINPILLTQADWDEESRTVYLISGGYNDDDLASEKYYKLYSILVGPSTGPSIEEARQYVLNNDLLAEIENTRYVNPGFSVGYDTAVYGYSKEGRYKVVLMTKHTYLETINVLIEAYLDEGVSEDIIRDVLIKSGYQAEEIMDIYLADSSLGEETLLGWHAVVNHEIWTIYYKFNFTTGELIPEIRNPYSTYYP